jgi:hypothetical protein
MSVQAPTVHQDTSDFVQKALEISRVYGKTSAEARMAWEAVEEVCICCGYGFLFFQKPLSPFLLILTFSSIIF